MTSKFKREMEMLNPYHFNTTSECLSFTGLLQTDVSNVYLDMCDEQHNIFFENI